MSEALSESRLLTFLQRALDFRASDAHNPTGILRLFAGLADGVEGLIVDKFGSLIVVTAYAPGLEHFTSVLMTFFVSAFSGCDVLIKARSAASGAAGEGFVCAMSSGFQTDFVSVGTEDGLQFEIHRDVRHDFGIFCDAVEARRLVRSLAKGKRVLNLFAYTCGFAVAACAGEAKAVVNVDPCREYLTWGKRNAALNGCDFAVIPDTAQSYLRRLCKRVEAGTAEGFDVVVLDPPAFGVGRGNDRLLRKLWPDFLEALALLVPEHIVVMCNDRAFRAHKSFEATLRQYLGHLYSLKRISHGKNIVGCEPGTPDSFYVPPEIFHLVRKKAERD